MQNDKTQKNRLFVNRWLGILSSRSCNLIELPSDIKNFLVVEDVSNSFIETRYYLSCREKELLKKILKLNIASIKMAELGINYVNSSLYYMVKVEPERLHLDAILPIKCKCLSPM